METLRYVVLANGLLAVVSLAYYVLLRRETFFGANRLALWLGLAGALILPLLELPDWRPQRVRTVMHRTAQIIVPRVLPKSPTTEPDVTITFPNQKTYQAFQKLPKPFSWSWQLGLILLYALGVLLLAIRFGLQVLSLRKLINRSTQEPYDQFTLVTNEQVTSPFSFFNWVVLNPSQHSIIELDQILRHERVHVRERHSLDMIGAELVCIIFWFNPAAYLFRQLVHQTLEFSADRTVLAEGVDAKAYQYNLLKVSLASGQSGISNHFSKSQLKSRIRMINQRESSKASWLKYPVFFIAALTVASAFARPQHINVLSHYLPRPIAASIVAIATTPKETVPSATEVSGTVVHQAEISKPNTGPTPQSQPASQQAELILKSEEVPTDKDSVRSSPSRYIQYQGNWLFWVVTPKTTFDDLVVMKQEFAKHGHTMQLNEIKYDPLYAYITRLQVSIKRASGGGTSCDELNNDNKPIPSIAGFVGIGPKSHTAGTGGLRYYKDYEIPEQLRKKAAEDEKFVIELIKDQAMEKLVQAGQRKYGHLGIGPRRFSKEEIISQSGSNSYLTVQPDSSLSVDETADYAKVFINNEPVAPQAIRMWKIKQFYTLVVLYGKGSDSDKRPGMRYLLFYFNEGN
ncbi:M56 family metallopeptidase [Spirosoma gilvum]